MLRSAKQSLRSREPCLLALREVLKMECPRFGEKRELPVVFQIETLALIEKNGLRKTFQKGNLALTGKVVTRGFLYDRTSLK